MVLGHQGQQRNGGTEEAGRHPGQAVEGLLGRGIQESGPAECGQPIGAGKQTVGGHEPRNLGTVSNTPPGRRRHL